MYPALRNSETVASISSYVYWGRNNPDEYLDLQDVLALALTCRAFLEPALDQLWRRQLNIFNLVKTLPDDAWEIADGPYISENGYRQQIIKNRRVIVPSDWPRFDYYAAKIRELGYDPFIAFDRPIGVEVFRPTGVPLATFMALCVVRLPFELIPNVRRLRWTTHEWMASTHIHAYMFLNPPLVSLTLDFSYISPHLALPEPESGRNEGQDPEGHEDANANDGDELDAQPGHLAEGEDDAEDDQGQAPLPPPPPASPPPQPPAEFDDGLFLQYTLKAALEQCPNIRDVEIVTHPCLEHYQEGAMECLHKAKNLRSFCVNVGDWSEDDLLVLAGKPTLKKARLFVHDLDYPWMPLARLQAEAGAPFANMVDLTLDAPSLECCTAFFAAWGACRLDTLRVTVEERKATEDSLHRFLATLASCCDVSALRDLHIADITTRTLADVTYARPDYARPDSAGAGADQDQEKEEEAENAELPPTALTGHALLPLTTFSALRSLTVDLSGVCALDNARFMSLVSSWPALESLQLSPARGWGARSGVTFAGLVHLVHFCPLLVSLSIAIDARRDDLAEGVAGLGGAFTSADGDGDGDGDGRGDGGGGGGGGKTPPPSNRRVLLVDLLDSVVREDEEGGAMLARNLALLFSELVWVQSFRLHPRPAPDGNVDEEGGEGPLWGAHPGPDVQLGEDVVMDDTEAKAPQKEPREELEEGELVEEQEEEEEGGRTPVPSPQPQIPEIRVDGPAPDAGVPAEVEAPERAPTVPWLASFEFWERVSAQVGTYRLLVDMDIPMDTS